MRNTLAKRRRRCGGRYIKRTDGRGEWKTSGRVCEIARPPPADAAEGRALSTAWPIIWSNGGPSVRNKSPALFCIGSSDDWPTFVPRRWSQLKVPSVKQPSPPDAEPRREIHTLTLARQFTVMGVCFFFLLLMHFLVSLLSSFHFSFLFFFF